MSLLVRRWERTIVINNSAVEKKYRLTCFSRMNTIMKRTKVCIGFISIFIIEDVSCRNIGAFIESLIYHKEVK